MVEETAKPSNPAPEPSNPAPEPSNPAPEPSNPTPTEPSTPAPTEPNSPTPTEPAPLEVPLEQQITDLPPLQYPGSENQEFQKWASERRRRRIRVEIVGGGLLLVGGVIAFVVSQRPAFVIIAVFALAALAAYEFLVNSFE